MHGGDIYRNHVEMDFSVSINPLPIPQNVKAALLSAIEHCTNYPDIYQEKLSRAVAKMLHINEECILFGNGASELFVAVLHGLKPKKVLLPVPGYLGYEKAVRAVEAGIIYYEMPKESGFCLRETFLDVLSEDVDLLFLTNPGNPVGNCIDAGLLQRILRRCREKDITVVLDECFIEFTDNGEQRSYVLRISEFPNLLIVRAFTKFFSMPGVRLGYLLTGNGGYLEKTALHLPEWNLSVFAQEAGVAAVKEREYYKKAIGLIKAEREYLLHEFHNMGVCVYPSDANFLMFYSEKEVKEMLLKRGILIRDLSDLKGLSKGYYRIGIRQHSDNEKLIDAMRMIMEE